jgi:hypothetical protein
MLAAEQGDRQRVAWLAARLENLWKNLGQDETGRYEPSDGSFCDISSDDQESQAMDGSKKALRGAKITKR